MRIKTCILITLLILSSCSHKRLDFEEPHFEAIAKSKPLSKLFNEIHSCLKNKNIDVPIDPDTDPTLSFKAIVTFKSGFSELSELKVLSLKKKLVPPAQLAACVEAAQNSTKKDFSENSDSSIEDSVVLIKGSLYPIELWQARGNKPFVLTRSERGWDICEKQSDCVLTSDPCRMPKSINRRYADLYGQYLRQVDALLYLNCHSFAGPETTDFAVNPACQKKRCTSYKKRKK